MKILTGSKGIIVQLLKSWWLAELSQVMRVTEFFRNIIVLVWERNSLSLLCKTPCSALMRYSDQYRRQFQRVLYYSQSIFLSTPPCTKVTISKPATTTPKRYYPITTSKASLSGFNLEGEKEEEAKQWKEEEAEYLHTTPESIGKYQIVVGPSLRLPSVHSICSIPIASASLPLWWIAVSNPTATIPSNPPTTLLGWYSLFWLPSMWILPYHW